MPALEVSKTRAVPVQFWRCSHSNLGSRKGGMRNWYWSVERCIFSVGESLLVRREGISFCVVCLAAQCPCMMGIF